MFHTVLVVTLILQNIKCRWKTYLTSFIEHEEDRYFSIGAEADETRFEDSLVKTHMNHVTKISTIREISVDSHFPRVISSEKVNAIFHVSKTFRHFLSLAATLALLMLLN